MIFNNPSDICDFYIDKVVCEGDIVVDATVGNGNDTLKLSNAVGGKGKVYGFDIQMEAINSAKEKNYIYNNVVFLNESHSELDLFINEEISFAIFNLGYLPGGNHAIMTTEKTTIPAIEKAMSILKPEGVIVLVIYRGGDTGFSESEAVISHIKGIDYRKFNVMLFDYINRPKNPPMVCVIEKKSVNKVI